MQCIWLGGFILLYFSIFYVSLRLSGTKVNQGCSCNTGLIFCEDHLIKTRQLLSICLHQICILFFFRSSFLVLNYHKMTLPPENYQMIVTESQARMWCSHKNALRRQSSPRIQTFKGTFRLVLVCRGPNPAERKNQVTPYCSRYQKRMGDDQTKKNRKQNV